MTPEESATVRVADALEAAGVAYMLAGSFSSNFYGVPRSTKDADFVVQLQTSVSKDFLRLLGDEFEIEPQLSFETNTGTYRQIIHQKGRTFKVELFTLSSDPHDQARFARRKATELFGRKLWLPTAEDVIVIKLRWGRVKDQDDAKNVMVMQAGKLDWTYIQDWCRRHGSFDKLEKIRNSISKAKKA